MYTKARPRYSSDIFLIAHDFFVKANQQQITVISQIAHEIVQHLVT